MNHLMMKFGMHIPKFNATTRSLAAGYSTTVYFPTEE